MNRTQRGWMLLRQSGAILKQDKSLLLFPVLSGIACLLILAAFILPVVAAWPVVGPHFQEATQAGQESLPFKIMAGTISFCYYLVNYFVIIFFNTALISCVLKRFRGETPTVRDGLNAAMQRLPQIMGWALVAATVGSLLRALEQRAGFLGRIAISFIGLAWTVATHLVTPILAAEGTGPITSLKRSAQLIRQTWGESLLAQLTLGAASTVIMLPAIALFIGAFVVLLATESVVAAIAMCLVALLYTLAAAIITSAMQQILVAGVYLYASERLIAPGLSEEVMTGAFIPKGRR